MSVIQSIRDKGAWILFGLIALALIAFILQDGLNRRGSLLGSGNTLGKINGTTVSKDEFERKLALYTQGNAQQREMMIGQLWNEEVRQTLLNEECDKLGIVCSKKELDERLFSEGSQLMQREFKDQKTGQLKVEEAKNAFAQIKKSKNAEQISGVYEGYIKPELQKAVQEKYQALFTQAAYVPKWLVEKQQADNGAIANISYVFKPYSSVVDSTIKVSDDEIMAYAKMHSKEYERDEESRAVATVSFEAKPSAADTAAVKSQLETMRADFITSNDMKLYFTKTATEIPYSDGYISGKDIKSAVKDTLTKLPVNGVFGPYIDGSNVVIAKNVGVKQWPDSAKVRHILIGTQTRNQQTGQMETSRADSTARKIMDTVEMALKAGAKFDSICAKYSDDGNKDKGGVYEFFPTNRMVAPFTDFSFDKPVGSKGVVKTEFGLHYVEVLEHKGNSAAYKIAFLAKPITISNETDNDVRNEASKFLAAAKSAKTKKQFDEEVAKLKKNSMPSGEVKRNDFSVGGLGSSRELVRWMYEHNEGDIVDKYYQIGDKYVVAMLTTVNKVGLPSAQTLKPQVEPLVKNEKKAKQLLEKFKGSTLEAIAAASGVAVAKADSISFNNNTFIPGVGNETKLTGIAFNKEMKGKVSEPIAGVSGVFAVRVESNGTKPSTIDAANIKQTLSQTMKSSGYRIQEALKKAASITDNRSDFY